IPTYFQINTASSRLAAFADFFYLCLSPPLLFKEGVRAGNSNDKKCRFPALLPNVYFYSIDHHKMPPFPVDDAGQRHLITQLFPGKAVAFSTKPDIFGCLANSQHGNSFAGNIRLAAQILQTVAFAVISGYHPQAGRAAVHGIELFIMRKAWHICYFKILIFMALKGLLLYFSLFKFIISHGRG